jgi:hypothetical protein
MMAEVASPSGALPVFDGAIGEEERRGARRDFIADGSELFLSGSQMISIAASLRRRIRRDQVSKAFESGFKP